MRSIGIMPGLVRRLLRGCVPGLPAAIATAIAIAGCVADPARPSGGDSLGITTGVLVVNEGVWRQDNATLTLFDPATGRAEQDYFARRNPGRRLGDVANDIVVRDGVATIPVSTSGTIELMTCSTGVSRGRIRLAVGNEPRAIAYANDSVGYAACLGDSVIGFNTRTMVATRAFHVGPAPEGIAFAHGRLFVANSGYGLYRRDEPGAGTISVLDAATLHPEAWIRVEPNPRTVIYNAARDRLYVLYGLADSAGGVVEIDPAALTETRRWSVMNARRCVVDMQGRCAYVIGAEGLLRIPLDESQVAPDVFFAPIAATAFYSVGVAPSGDRIYLGATRNYASPGEVLVLDERGRLLTRFACGVNPGAFGFY